MKRILITLLTLIVVEPLLKSQNEVDALRYSNTTFNGTARYMSMGGAFGALGADFSSLSTNPGGIGLYNKSEFTVTPGFYFGQTTSTYNGTKGNDSKFNFDISNVGLIYTTKTESRSNSIVKSFQYGFGMNRLNNFNNRMMISGNNSTNSIINTYTEQANGINYSDIEDDPNGNYAYDLNLAWYTYLIDTVPGYSNLYNGAVGLPPGGNLLQRKDIETWGSMNEMLFTFGTNLADRLYLGASFAFPYIRYFERSTYSEEDINNQIYDFRSMQLYQYLKTHGSGFNMKFGMIFRATDWLRLGGAIHSPTWFNNMHDEWNYEMTSTFDNNDYISKWSPYGNYDYDLQTPWRAIGSIAFVVAKVGLISADYEYIDYSKAKLRAPQYSFYDENNAIETNYTHTQNIRIGAEYRLGSFSFRGGYGIYGSPFASGINDGQKSFYSGGLGFRDKDFFLDLAYVRSSSNEDYYLYGTQDIVVNPVKNKLVTNNILLTLGFRF